ncbi:hypothetical protein EV363DRAFT_1323612 [Boletus edulis]|nr:hypothetical protein EV363DRAFT_1323612 [Boletus edulis]
MPKKEVKWIRASEFVKSEGWCGGLFTSEDGATFRWKTHKRCLQLQLVNADDEEKVPIAEYHPFKRHFLVFRMSERAWLEVKPEATAALEKIIVSYLIVERRRREAKIRIKLEHE